MVIVLIKQWAG